MQSQHEYPVVSAASGRFHLTENPAVDPDAPIWTPLKMKCGRILKPVNFFMSRFDANIYCGERLSQYLCQDCERAARHSDQQKGV